MGRVKHPGESPRGTAILPYVLIAAAAAVVEVVEVVVVVVVEVVEVVDDIFEILLSSSSSL